MCERDLDTVTQMLFGPPSKCLNTARRFSPPPAKIYDHASTSHSHRAATACSAAIACSTWDKGRRMAGGQVHGGSQPCVHTRGVRPTRRTTSARSRSLSHCTMRHIYRHDLQLQLILSAFDIQCASEQRPPSAQPVAPQ